MAYELFWPGFGRLLDVAICAASAKKQPGLAPRPLPQ